MTKYKAIATEAAVARVVSSLAPDDYEILLARCAYRGETLAERIGATAWAAGRHQDVADLVAVPAEPEQDALEAVLALG